LRVPNKKAQRGARTSSGTILGAPGPAVRGRTIPPSHIHDGILLKRDGPLAETGGGPVTRFLR